MESNIVILLVWLFFLNPILILQVLLGYFKAYHREHSILLRMIYHIGGEYITLATESDMRIRKWYLGYFGSLIVLLNIYGSILYYLIVYSISPPSFLIPVIGPSLFVIAILGLILLIKNSIPYTEVVVWREILQRDGINIDDIPLKFNLWSRFNNKKIIILSQSYFKDKYPEVNRHLIPNLRFSWFKPPVIKDEPNEIADLHVMEDCKTAKLWKVEYPKKVILSYVSLIFLILATSFYATANMDELFTSLNLTLPNSVLYILIILLIMNSFVSAYYYKQYFLPSDRIIDAILKDHQIKYTEDTRLVELLLLIDNHYPFVNLDEYRQQ
ncbi:MAG: hypothetical protein INQ03_25025 [Candidatus Heimdallarchaeota archaeon]|nr:hypothetical protein [Candidatus Heimdallarchaeota archaeon]